MSSGGAASSGSITNVPSIEVGHHTDAAGGTGCTVVLSRTGAVGGVDVRGSAPATRETDLLDPTALVSEVHAILLTGGSVFGLDAAAGVQRYLEDRGHGLRFAGQTIPIVPGAALFDLGVNGASARPGPEDGYRACERASSGPVEEGSVGAGTGAAVAKLRGPDLAVKGGIGSACVELGDGLLVGAIVAVNALGDVVDPNSGAIVAGPTDGRRSTDALLNPSYQRTGAAPLGNATTIGVVATNAALSKAQATKLAQLAQDGVALAVRPAHTMSDGDAIFTLATRSFEGSANMYRLGAAAVEATAAAIVRGVTQAKGLGGIPSMSELNQ